MIHNELRVDIAVVKDMNNLIRKQMKAIDAIFELHKPFHDNVLDCVQCKVEYPCPTIQVIKKELL